MRCSVLAMPLIAGHSLVNTPHGRACEWCGRTWVSILNAREFWKVREHGIAHAGALVIHEVEELEAELARIWDATVASAVASGMEVG